MPKAAALLALVCAMALCAAAYAANINGTDGPDTIVGTPQNDKIDAMGGNDQVFGLGGNDMIDGGAGNDTIEGDGSCPPDTTYCIPDDQGGDDHIDGGPGRDTISGGDGNDHIRARDGEVDRISCGAGRDHVIADRNDVVSGDCEHVVTTPPQGDHGRGSGDDRRGHGRD